RLQARVEQLGLAAEPVLDPPHRDAGSRCHGAHRYLVHTPLGDYHPHRAQDLVRLLGVARTDHHSSLEHRIQAYGRMERSDGRLLSTVVSTTVSARPLPRQVAEGLGPV